MTTVRRVALGVLALLVAASAVFALRSWVGLEPADRAAPSASSRASASPTPSPTPTPTRSSPSPTPEDSPSPKRRDDPPTATRMSTATAAAFVKARLDRKGRPTSVACPPDVPAVVGVRFRCTVALASAPGRPVADATVTLTGPRSVRFVSVPR